MKHTVNNVPNPLWFTSGLWLLAWVNDTRESTIKYWNMVRCIKITILSFKRTFIYRGKLWSVSLDSYGMICLQTIMEISKQIHQLGDDNVRKAMSGWWRFQIRVGVCIGNKSRLQILLIQPISKTLKHLFKQKASSSMLHEQFMSLAW